MKTTNELPILEVDLGNQNDPQQPRVRLLNWNTVNCADLYSEASQSDASAKITKIQLHYNNSSSDTINGEVACESFLTEFRDKMGYEFKTFITERNSLAGQSSHTTMHAGAGSTSR